ncbi:Spectrin beta chain, non-erythrocytic 1, partial [Orchesella cincta]
VSFEVKNQVPNATTRLKENLKRVREDALKFETGRIKALQEERLHIQKKTFTKWMNSFLVKARMEVEDLFTDLADGKKLLKLLEIISGEKLGKPNNGRMRVHKIENVNKSLAFLHTKVRLESIGAEDIVDGNPRLILGLIWTIILRFQIQEIEIDVDEENESSEKKSAKDALLLWCQRKTKGYQNVNIQDFSGSWRSGLGFNALIHAHRPDLLEFDKLVPNRHIDNLNNAFDVAERGLGIPSLLDAEDIDTAKPDEKSVLTYVASYYHTFAQMYNKDKSGRRIANIISQIKEADDLKYKYELDGKNLLAWIRATIKELNSRDFPNNLEGVQKLLQKFTEHIADHKPPKYNEKSEIEANYFIINTRLKELNQHSYTPPEGLLVHDIERAWAELEKSEYLRELALREEVIRQTNLEQLAIRFDKKSMLREGYLKDMIQVLSDPRYGINLAQVEATLKKHEAISADILAREQRCEQLVTMAEYLVKENYHDCDRVRARAEEITRTWGELISLLDTHKINLEKFSMLMQMIRDIDTILTTIQDLQEIFNSHDVGVHLIGVEDLLQKHSLVESQISSMGDIKRIGKQAANYAGKELSTIEPKIKLMNTEYGNLVKSSKERRNKLEDSKAFFQFVQDCEEEDAWVNEKNRVVCQAISCKDLRGVMSVIGGHKLLLDELKARKGQHNKIVEKANELCRIWEAEQRGVKDLEIKDFYSDANEMDSWVTEKRPLVSSSDYGEDEPSAQALLQRHVNLEEEIIAYEVDIKGLNSQADKLVKAGINSIQEVSATETPAHSNGIEHSAEEYVTEQKLVPEEYYEDEEIERTDYKTVTEERAVPQVKALYAFDGQEIHIKKGEVMFLLNKTNADWWNVRKANGEDGFVPANYVKEIEPKVVMVQVRKPEVVKETKRTKKTRMVLQNVTKPKKPGVQVPISTGTLKKSASAQSNVSQVPTEPITTRTSRINNDYKDIISLSAIRKQNLQESIKLFAFLRECDDFEKWINEKKKYLQTNEPNVQVAKRAFEKFLTDLTASNNRIQQIDTLVEQFENSKSTNPKTMAIVRARADKIKQDYEDLISLKSKKEQSLEGALSVELFNRTCEDDWMSEKMMQIDTDEWSNDLKTVQALQRKHNNLERELAPIQEKVSRVNLLAESVKKSYPNETDNVDERRIQVINTWESLVNKASGRKHALENAVGMQIFISGVKNLVHWVSGVKDQLNAYVPSRDVSSAEEALKIHSELGDEIKSKSHEFEELSELGKTISSGNVNVQEKLELLANEHEAIHRGFGEKTDWLNQVLDLQMFLREADHIDSATKNHMQFVSNTDVGKNLDEVESLIKRHNDFENTLVAQDERLKIFDSMGAKLIDAGHFERDLINERRNNVIEKKNQVKELAKSRKLELGRSLKYHEFNTDVEETIAWVNEKISVARDESYKDLSNVDKKLKKHEAFAGELRANEVRIKSINRSGDKLVEVVPEKETEVRASVGKLNALWDELTRLSDEKYDKLRQAEAQAGFNKTLDSVVDRLEGIRSNVHTDCAVNDRRSCKDAVKRANLLANELGAVDGKIRELENVADDMEKDGHFDGERIKDKVREAKHNMQLLVAPVEDLKKNLDEKYAYYSFLHELEAEISWINEKRDLVEREVQIQDLYQAQTCVKKHKKLEQEVMNREPIVKKIIEKGDDISKMHPHVDEKLKEFQDSWDALKSACVGKNKKLDLSLKSQQFFFDAGEIEAWMQEKQNLLASEHYGKDMHSAVKLLTKHKTLELEMDSYNGLVTEMKHMANQMVSSGHPDSKVISAKIGNVEDHMGLLKKLANERREKLIESVHTLEYFAEADEFLKYVDEVFGREVSCNEYGSDYEHLCLLQARFRDVEHKVEGTNERFKTLEDMAARLRNLQVGRDAVEAKNRDVGEKWNNMLALMAAREQKLHAPGKYTGSTGTWLTRWRESRRNSTPFLTLVNSCEGMLRQHEAFENDLLALEAQLQVLVDDAARLQQLYPTNAENIRQEQSLVIESWNNLQTRASLRKEQLQNAVDFWRFSAEYASLTSFMNSLLTTLPSQPKVRDTASSQALMTEHERIRSEIEAREESYDHVLQLAHAMVSESHPETDEVSRMVSNLKNLKEKLLVTWEHKRVYLDQLIDLNIFLRDAKQLETNCSGQEITLNSEQLGDSVEETDKAVKKHEAFDKLIHTQDDKFKTLDSQGNKLIKQNHFDSKTVEERLKDVAAARNKIKRLCEQKRQALAARYKYVQFIRDVGETTAFVDEKIKKLIHDSSVNSSLTLQEKIKKLKKHQAFSAEVNSNRSRSFYDEANELTSWMSEKHAYVQNVECKENENVSSLLKRLEAFQRDLGNFYARIEKLQKNGDELVNRNHFDSENIEKKIQEVTHEYSELQKRSDKKRCRLLDAQKFYDFNRACNETVDWINEMMNIAGSEEYGRDVEHVESLIQKFELFMGNVQEGRALHVQNLADELVEEGYPEPERIRGRAAEVKSSWEEFKELAAARLEALQGAKQVHAFDRTADETIAWINEKHAVVCSEEYGHDLESIQALIRRHHVFENDLKPVESKVNEVRSEADRLRSLFVDASEHIDVKLQACLDSWKELVERTRTRGDKLNQAENMQAYFDKYTELMAFVNEMVAKVTSGELGNVQAAETSLAKNKSYSQQIDSFKGVHEFVHRGEGLIKQGHFMGEEIHEKIRVLSGRWEYLNKIVDERDVLFKQNLDLRVYLVQLEDFDKWLNGKEPELKYANLGESIREVEELIREHDEFASTLEAQEARVEGLKRKTLIEEAWENMKKREEAERELQVKRMEKERAELLKRKEVERITNEINKKREEDSVDTSSVATAPRGGFLGNTRFGSFVFGRDGRRGSEPVPASPKEDLSQSPFLKPNATPPPSLIFTDLSSQQQNEAAPQGLSRSESLRLLNTTPDLDSGTLKKPKRTPSFTTRRRTASFRNKKKLAENLPPVEIEGYLERKHELQAGGKRAAVRSWKHYYVLLCGQLLCFFKDQEDFELSKVGSSSPISVYLAKCEVASDYTKRKHKPTDGSEFLFAADNHEVMDAWVKKINFHAVLDPKNQLEKMDTEALEQSDRGRMMPPPPPPPKTRAYESSSTDEDEPCPRKPKPRSNLQQPRSREPIYANNEVERRDTPLSEPPVQLRSPSSTTAAKPPIPPRSSSIVEPNGTNRSPAKHNGSGDAIDNQQYFHTSQAARPVSVDRMLYQAHSVQQRYYNSGPPVSHLPPAPLPRSMNTTFKPQIHGATTTQPPYIHTRGSSFSREFIPISVNSSVIVV